MTTTHMLPPSDDLDAKQDAGPGLGALVAMVNGEEQPFPLRSVRVRSLIAGPCVRTEIEQRFANTLDVPVEAVHIFPLPGDGAVIDVLLTAGEVTVRGECRERKEAEARFARAREQGHRATLVTQERADVHTLRVTNLPPRAEVCVQLVVVEKLDASDGCYQWRFPTTIAPRYTPGTAIGHEGPGVVPDTDRVPDASRLQPPIRLQGGTLLDLEARIVGRVATVRSTLHACQMTLEDGSVRVAPSGQATLNKDFVLEFGYADEDRTSVRAWTDGEYSLVTVAPPAQLDAAAMPRDAVFVIDISGSMTGAKLEAAKRAVTAALHGLVAGDRFSLLAFDDHVQAFADQPVEYEDRTLARGDRWIASLVARGGTELLPALERALAGEQPANRLRTVLLITDGQVTNESELLRAMQRRRGRARLFVVGVDTAPNAPLLARLARAGGGTCDLCSPAADIEAAIARMEARFGSPLMEEVRVDGEVASPLPLTLFAGRPASVLLRGAPAEIHAAGASPAGAWRGRGTPQRVDFSLAPLWARDRVQALEDEIACEPSREATLRSSIIAVALEHGIASRFTAFVAVERSLTVEGKPVEIVQPIELPELWDEMFAARGTALGLTVRSAAAPMQSARFLAAKEDGDEMIDTMYFRRPKADRGVPPATRQDEQNLDSPLARAQRADGSFGGDVKRTVAALLALVLLGHTRKRGLRKRTVQKAAAWLQAHARDPLAKLALDVLARAERGDQVTPSEEWRALADQSEEGRCLAWAMA